ncbi:MAG TPA: hypothetical protein VLJ16_06160 [Acidobacteriota bacterium]|nr:hypothetical protein [Acidobacteriota bacterium]
MSEHTVEKAVAGVIRTYELLDRVRTRQDLVIRDDQFDLEALRDAVGYARRRRIRLSLLDTGRFGLAELEALAKGGARLLTSDEARPRADEWAVLGEACRKGGTHLSVFWKRPLPGNGAASGPALQDLGDVLSGGLDFHISDRDEARDAASLAVLAAAAKKGKAYFVVYHIGPPAASFAALAGERAWVHFADGAITDEAGAALAVEIASAAARAGSRAVVHIEHGLPLDLLEALWDAGAALLFLMPPSDGRSLLRPIERRAPRRKLPARAFYLSTAFLP